MPITIAILSDTHGQHSKFTIPECDILIHCGDYSYKGYQSEVKDFYTWLNLQPAKIKISLQGNHEVGVERDYDAMKALAEQLCPGVHFMSEGELQIEGIKFYCMSHQPWFHSWAWNVFRGQDMQKIVSKIPVDTEFLISHAPPHGILDWVPRFNRTTGITDIEHVGCADLLDRIEQTQIKCHSFGHIHEGAGVLERDGRIYINASMLNDNYRPNGLKPHVIIRDNQGNYAVQV